MPDPPPVPRCWNCEKPLTEATAFLEESYTWDADKGRYCVSNVNETEIDCDECGADVTEMVLRNAGPREVDPNGVP